MLFDRKLPACRRAHAKQIVVAHGGVGLHSPHLRGRPDKHGRWSVTLQLALSTSRAENHLEDKVVAATT